MGRCHKIGAVEKKLEIIFMTETITTCDLCGAKMPKSTVSPTPISNASDTSVAILHFSVDHVDGLKKSVAHVSVSVDGGSELDVCNKCILGKMGIAINMTAPITKP